MRADSQDVAGSKNWGLVTIPKPGGEPTVIRVIQSEVAEDSNMMKITWMWSHKDVTHQVELRHGRRSGIRKIYVDKVLQDRIKSVRNLLSDTGSSHDFKVGEHEGAVTISPKGVTGFTYQLKLDGQGIEQSIVRPPAPACRARRLARARHPMGLAAPRRRTEEGGALATPGGAIGAATAANALPAGGGTPRVAQGSVDSTERLAEDGDYYSRA